MRKSTLDYLDEKIKELKPEERAKLDDKLLGMIVEDSANKKKKYEIEIGADYLEEAKEMYENFGKFQGTSTGYKSIDYFTKGLVDGELIIIGGATSNGKTSLALNIACNVMKAGKSVLVVTLEMTKPQVVSRIMIADPNYEDYIANLVFQKHDEFGWEDIDGLIENAKVNMGVDLVVIDHLHHFTRELRNVAEDLGRITKEFQKNAKRHKVPIILISHTRKGEGKGIDELRGCIPEGTKILTGRGNIPIESVIPGDKVISIDSNLKTTISEVRASWCTGDKDTLDITLDDGRNIDVSKKHMIFNGEKYIEAKDLNIGEWVAIHESPNISTKNTFTDSEWELAGWLVGDGSIKKGNELCVANDYEVDYINKLGIDNTSFKFTSEKIKGAYRCYISSGKRKGINKLLSDNNMRHTAINKTFGSGIFVETDSHKKAFLRGYFHADGSTSSTNKQLTISCSTISKQLANDCVLLLSQLGIGASMRINHNKPNGTIAGKKVNFTEVSYCIYFSGADAHKFVDEIGFIGEKQNRAISHKNKSFKPKKHTKYDLLPWYIWESIKNQIDQSKYSEGKRLSNSSNEIISWDKLGYRPRQYAHKQALKQLDNKFIRSNIQWRKITSIVDTGIKTTYDLEISKTHNYSINGVITHNSSLIAQDADIVLMVHRDNAFVDKIAVTIEKNRNRGYNFSDNKALLNFDRTRIYEGE